MKLYFSKGACSLSVRIIAHELGLKLDYEAVDLHTKKTATGNDYYAVNIKGSVPALLLDNGELLTENVAIQEYLADTYPSTLLPPQKDFQRYRVLEWLSFMASDVHKGFGPLFSSEVPQALKDTIFLPSLKNKLNLLDKHFSGHTYLLGDTFTLPDAYCFVMMRWLSAFKIPITVTTRSTPR